MARGRLGILVCRSNLGGSLDSSGVGRGQRNIGVARLRKCRVREVWFWGFWAFFFTL